MNEHICRSPTIGPFRYNIILFWAHFENLVYYSDDADYEWNFWFFFVSSFVHMECARVMLLIVGFYRSRVWRSNLPWIRRLSLNLDYGSFLKISNQWLQHVCCLFLWFMGGSIVRRYSQLCRMIDLFAPATKGHTPPIADRRGHCLLEWRSLIYRYCSVLI
jgi:hypothetical protein